MKTILKKTALFLWCCVVFHACTEIEDTNANPEPPGTGEINVVMTVNLRNSSVTDQTVSYNNANGERITETLTSNEWTRTIRVMDGFMIFFNASGIGDGGAEVEVNVDATENGTSVFAFDRTETGGIAFDYDITIEHEL